jgi:hypothetical protein
MCKNVTYEGCEPTDRRLPASGIQFPVHLREHRNTDRCTYGTAYGRKSRVLQAESVRKVAPRHHEKAGKPRARKLLYCRSGESAGRQMILQYAMKGALH